MKAIIETNTLFKRNLLLSIRSMETLLSGILTPAILMILFVYVFGGSHERRRYLLCRFCRSWCSRPMYRPKRLLRWGNGDGRFEIRHGGTADDLEHL